MTATPPDARPEYSRGRGPLSAGARFGAWPSRGRAAAPLAGALTGAIVLLVAEFLPLYSLHVITSGLPAGSTSVGSHDSWALVPVALLVAALALGPVRRGSRPALAAVCALGAITLVIALGADLPDARAHGVIHGTLLAATTPAVGLYVEALGAIVLLAAGGLPLLAGVSLPDPRVRRRRTPDPRSGY